MEFGDRKLVARAREGDLDAFAELVRRHERGVRAVVARLLDDERDVEEASAFTWLYRIAVNEAKMRLRRKRLPTSELDDVPERELAAAAAPDEDLRRFLTTKLRELPFDLRAPVVLRDLQGLPNQEVAEVLGISLAAAKSRIHRGRMRIRAELERWERS